MTTPLISTSLGCSAPLVGFNRTPEVVAAVTNAGGFGVLAAVNFTPDGLDRALTWIESQVDGKPYGVDILVPERTEHSERSNAVDPIANLRERIPAEHREFVESVLAKHHIPALPSGHPGGTGDVFAANTDRQHTHEILDVAFSHDIRLVANALGPPPAYLVSRARSAGVPVAALVGTPRHAERQVEAGVDILVAQGYEAGGHVGTIATMVLTPEVIRVAGGVPVLAAGGIASGDQMAAALALGANGVWCGSVWLSSIEDMTPRAVKEKFLEAGAADTVRSPVRTGKPARQLRSAWHDEWEAPGSPSALPLPLQRMLIDEAWARIDDAADAGHPGARGLASFFIGQVVGSFNSLRSTDEITRTMISDCARRMRELGTIDMPVTAPPDTAGGRP